MKSFKKQKGVAIIVVALSMVAIGGMAQLAVEGSRIIQERNRLADAAEAATLAVSIANRSDKTFSDQMARDYLEKYLPNVDIENVNVIRKEGQEEVDGNKLYYVQYEVEADAKFGSQLSFINSGSGDSDSRAIGNEAMAKTYMLPSDLDLVYVADFSGSMDEDWSRTQTRLEVLKEQVNIISDDLLSSGAVEAGYAHRIGFVPYNMRTQELVDGERRCVTELEYKSATVDGVRVNHSDIDWYQWGYKRVGDVSECSKKAKNCPDFSTQAHASVISDIFDQSRRETGYGKDTARWPDPLSYIDIDKTVRNWNISKTVQHNLHPNYSDSGMRLFGGSICGSKAKFETIGLSNQKPIIDDMEASGGTSVYQGFIRGAQILASARPDKDNPDDLEEYFERSQMLLILSDGQEDPYRNTFSRLVNAGLCTEIREHFKDHERPLYIGVIGISFDASGQTGFRDCADEIIDVSNSEDLLEKIQELIQKGAATSGVSRLYDKTL